MMALAILGIGAVGLAAIQKTTIIGNSSARNLVTANAVASTWVERLRTDALRWGSTGAIGSTDWLKNASPGLGAWHPPPLTTGVGSPSADIMGADLFAAGPQAQAFCTHLRLTRLYPTMVRAEVRVFWNKQGGPVACDQTIPQVEADARYGFVYLTTSIPQGAGG
jgi:type IV pilus assembly protein PilV